MTKPCCPCDRLEHPNPPEIPAGLTTLPRQLAEFSEYRLAMLQDIPTYPALAQWRAREGDDLGIMLLEMWAYILDILAFYDGQIANETYLRTAIRSASLYKLVRLIGYHPRPALAASVVLGAIADGKQLVILPPRTAFRSDAFGDEPPQIFETEVEQTIHPFLNEWTLAQVRDTLPNGNQLLLELDTARVAVDQLVLLRTNTQSHVGRVTKTAAINALDGNTYLKIELDPAPTLNPTVSLETIELLSPTLSASPNLLPGKSVIASSDFQLRVARENSNSDDQPLVSTNTLGIETAQPGRIGDISIAQPTSQTAITLDAIYPQFAEQESVVVQRGKEFLPATVLKIDRQDVAVSQEDNAPTFPATRIVITPKLPSHWTSNLSRLVIHFQMTQSGTLTRVAKTELDTPDLTNPGIPIEGLVEPLPAGVSTSGELLLQDGNDNGLLVEGAVSINPQGQGKVTLVSSTPPIDPRLRTPVTVFGNLIRASRGESVIDEVLGSGDGTQRFQSFTLQNNPLTYLNDPSAPNGRRSTLSVRVNGILWREVPSFFGSSPHDEVYVVRQNEQQETIITFGGGARLPTGIDNVTATYRFGAGAAKPPAGAIAQLANPVEGLRRAVSPIAPEGGADGDRPQDLRRNAPTSALLLGRAVSTQDFEALAREFGGIINAKVEWAWDETCQRAVVKVWFITDDGEVTNPEFVRQLREFLVGQADPTTPLVVQQATAQSSELTINVTVDPRFSPQTVREQIRQALTHPETGLFALANIPIGRPLFRSQIFAAVLAIEGADAVSALTLDGSPAPFALTVPQGHYRNFLSQLVIKSTPASRGLIPLSS